MGHTLVTHFTKESADRIRRIMQEADAEHACKIPYGRDCERKEADQLLPHHITVFHWAKEYDAIYLSRLKEYRFNEICHVRAVRASLVCAEENSLLLRLDVKPEEDFMKMAEELEKALGKKTSRSLHITLAVSKDHDEMKRIVRRINEQNLFPLRLCVSGLDLYHIWRPVRKVKSFVTE